MNMKKIIALLYAVWISIAIVCASSVEVRSARALYAKKDYVGAMENLKKAIKDLFSTREKRKAAKLENEQRALNAENVTLEIKKEDYNKKVKDGGK